MKKSIIILLGAGALCGSAVARETPKRNAPVTTVKPLTYANVVAILQLSRGRVVSSIGF